MTTAVTPRPACAGVDPAVFFPDVGGNADAARAICNTCPITEQCLQWAIDNREKYGVWGGLVEEERRRLIRTGRIHAKPQFIYCEECGTRVEINTRFGPKRRFCSRTCNDRHLTRRRNEEAA